MPTDSPPLRTVLLDECTEWQEQATRIVGDMAKAPRSRLNAQRRAQIDILDYCTDSDATGGIQFQSRALGPCCAAKWLAGAKKHNEERSITARCPEGKSFANGVREDLRC